MPRKIYSSTNHKHTVARWDKTRPRIRKHFTKSETLPRFQKHVQNSKHVQNPKTLLRIQNTFQSPKHFPESKTLRSENPKALVITQNTSPKPKTLLDSGKCFGFGDMFLDSGTRFWILGRVLDFVKCFFYSGTSYGFWEVFCPYQTRYKHYPDQGSNTCDCNDLYFALVPHIIIL